MSEQHFAAPAPMAGRDERQEPPAVAAPQQMQAQTQRMPRAPGIPAFGDGSGAAMMFRDCASI